MICTPNAGSPTLVYLAGYGRSGSTLLDMLLGNHSSAFGAGELTWLFQQVEADGGCSCGAPLKQCEFWQSVLQQLFRQLPSMSCAKAAAVTSAAQLPLSTRDTRDYAQLWDATLRAIREVSGKSLIVDSSKSTRRSYRRLSLMQSQLSLPVRAIHLIRDPRGVMWSSMRGSNKLLEKGQQAGAGSSLRGLASWIVANSSVELLRRKQPSLPILRLRYEDLVQDPAAALDRLGAFLGIEMAEVMARLKSEEPLSAGHGIAGNRMRRQGKVVLRFDQEWKQRLPRTSKVLAVSAWPLMKKYQYV